MNIYIDVIFMKKVSGLFTFQRKDHLAKHILARTSYKKY